MARPGQPNADPAAPAVWSFDLTPAGSDHDPLPQRIARAVAYAQAHGLTPVAVRLDLQPDPRTTPPVACRVRSFLKDAGRRCGLRARWPTEPTPHDEPADRPDDARC